MKIETVFGILFGIACVVAGVVFRPFWLSPVGPYAFIGLVWLSTSLGMGWAGRGKPYSWRFGMIIGTAVTVPVAIMGFINSDVGLAAIGLVFYLLLKSKIVDRRSEELRAFDRASRRSN